MSMNIELQIDASKAGDILVVTLKGDLDDFNGPKMSDFFKKELSNGSKRLIVNMDQLQFLDSIGLGVIVRAAKTVREEQGDLYIVCVKPQIIRLLESSGLIKSGRLTVYEDIDKALEAI